MEKIRLILVGCGRISYKHFDAWEKNKDVLELVAVCDCIEEKAKICGEKYGVRWYTDYREMLEEEEADLVAICTPSGLHPDHAILAAEKGIHIISEKPMATCLRKANAMIEACDKNKVKLFIVKQNRLNTTLKLVKNAIDKGRFGRIYMGVVNVFWTRPQTYYDAAKWRGTWEFDGGVYMNQASHYVDMLTWLLGPVDSVMAYTSTLERKIEAEDSGVASLKFRNGALGSINATVLTYPKNLEGSLTIIGEKGTVKVGGMAVNKIEHWDFLDYDEDDKLVEQCNYNPPNVYGFGHDGYYKNVIKTLKNQSEANIDGREGKKSLEIIQAIYKSAKQGKKIALPLEGGE